MADEIELKLDVNAEAARALEATPPWSGDSKVAEQRSIYFDTPELALSKAGLSLRIRESGLERIQTVKAKGGAAGGLFVRAEWERPVQDDLPILDDSTPIRAVIGDSVDAIGPMFEVRVERRIWIVDQDEAVIELVLDKGEVVAGDRATQFCEIELELKSGDPAALFALARKMDAVAPVRLGVLSKAERGGRLLGPTSRMFKAEPILLSDDLTAAGAFRKIVHSCVRQYRLNETLLLVAPNSSALHQARVALRRLRSAFSIFKPIIGGSRSDKLREDLRWLASELGEARDLDVLRERIRSGPLFARIVTAHSAAYGRVEEVLASARVRVLMLELMEWTTGSDWLVSSGTENDTDDSARDFAAQALDRFRRKVKRGGPDLACIGDDGRHEVRKDAKKLRYASEFFSSLFERKRERRRYKTFIAALEDLQDQLGALNDLATAPILLKRIGGADDPDAARLLAAEPDESVLERAADAHADLIDTKRFWK